MKVSITSKFSELIVFSEDTIHHALGKITSNKKRLIFVVSESGILEGVMTDGDFRRWIERKSDIDMSLPVAEAMNKTCIYASEKDSVSVIGSLLSAQVIAIPLLDSYGRIVAVALPGNDTLQIGTRQIGNSEPVFIIAEVGNNHNGQLSLAIELIDAAYSSGADCVKFQMRDLGSLYANSGDQNDISLDLAAQYTLDLLNNFQLPDEQLFTCFDYAHKKGLIPLCTAWDEISLLKLDTWGLEGFKVASADFTNYPLIRAIINTRKPIICSTGMSNESEILSGIKFLQQSGAQYALLHCNSTYPTPFKDVNLRYLTRLRERSNAPVGYSGHERGFEIPIAAVAMGACIIEKHITLDRSMEGNDHKVSLLPGELAQMVEGIRRVEESMGEGGNRSISQGEMLNRENLAKSLVAASDIPAGSIITLAMVGIKSPGQGLQPNRLDDLIGSILETPKKKGELFFESDLGAPAAVPRDYKFNQQFGVPVRYHDINYFAEATNLDLVEVHLSYKDLEVDLGTVLKKKFTVGLVVHTPELFSGEHILDLCSLDINYRAKSISNMQQVVDIACRMREYFQCSKPVLLVTNVGGFSANDHRDKSTINELVGNLNNSLESIHTYGSVEIIPQTMPPFPWHFGGQRFHNVFVDPDLIAEFCKVNNMRVCLDVSHSKLACNHLGISFVSFLGKVLPHTAHLHLADAKGIDGEGLQIGDGEIDWTQLFQLVDEHCNESSFIPEIWQGHKNEGEAVWLALERLEAASKIVTQPMH